MSSRDSALLESAPANPEITRPRRRIPRARILAIAAAWSSVWWLIIGALIAPLVPGGWLTIAGAVLLSVAPLLVILERFNGTYATAATRIWIFRPFLYIQLGTLLVALTAATGTILGALIGRGIVVGRWTVAIASASFALAAILGYIGSRQLRVNALDACYPDLPAALDGLRIVQLTDLHLGPHTPARHIRRIVDAVEAAQPDAIVSPAIRSTTIREMSRRSGGHLAACGRRSACLPSPAITMCMRGGPMCGLVWKRWEYCAGQSCGRTFAGQRIVLDRRHRRSSSRRADGPRHRCGPDIERTLAGIPRGAFTIALAHTRRSSRHSRSAACRSR